MFIGCGGDAGFLYVIVCWSDDFQQIDRFCSVDML